MPFLAQVTRDGVTYIVIIHPETGELLAKGRGRPADTVASASPASPCSMQRQADRCRSEQARATSRAYSYFRAPHTYQQELR